MITYNWNLKHLYKNNEEFLQDLENAKKYLENLNKFKNKLNKENEDDILKYFELDSKFSAILEKLAVYSFCKQDDDAKDETNIKNYAMIDDFMVKVGQEQAFAKIELTSLSENFLTKIQTETKFCDYSRAIGDVIRNKKHTLSEKEEQNMSKISGFSGTSDIFSVLSNIEMNHGTVNFNGEEIKLSTGNYGSLMNSKEPEKRALVMETYLAEYGRLNQTFAGLFTSHIKYENFLAETYGFKNVLDMKCYNEEVDPEIMMVNIKNVSAKVGLLQKYFKLKQQILGLKTFKASDISVDLFSGEDKVVYDEVVEDIFNAFEPLGKDYQDMFRKAIESGWIDVYPRENKTSGGYTISTYGEHPYILLNFDGTRSWASAIAHEFGHAMHSLYSAQNQPYYKSNYTLFVAEIVSLTNEILYNKYLLSKTSDKKQKMKLISEFLSLFELNVYDSSMLAEFELYAHDEIQKGISLSPSDYNKKYLELCKKYMGDFIEYNKGYEFNWSRKSHIYRDYYLYKYSLGLVCACMVARNILGDKTGEFAKNYKEFLKLGGSLPPIESLKVAGIDVLSNNLYDEAFLMFEEYLQELENLNKSIEKA